MRTWPCRPGELRDTREATLPGVGATVLVEAAAAALPPVSGPGLPYRGEHGRGSRPVTGSAAAAIPYFQWDNRDGPPMRVWMPLADAGQPARPLSPAR